MDVRKLVLLLSMLVLSACTKVNLYSQLGEEQANEIVAVLLQAGIDADKEPSDSKSWVVKTAKNDLPRAVQVLRESGYPREQFKTFNDIFKDGGLAPSPTEERARLIYGLSQELAHTLSSIDGVIAARVHVALPERDALSEHVQPSSAAVFIKYRKDADLASRVSSIKALVVNSIEGLPYDNVTVTLFPAEQATQVPAPQRVAGRSELSAMMAPAVWWIGPVAGAVVLLVGAVLWLRHGGTVSGSRAGRLGAAPGRSASTTA